MLAKLTVARLSRIALAIGLCVAPSAFAGVTILDDGASGAPARIRLRGPIIKGDQRAFEQALNRIRGAVAAKVNDVPLITVELDSPGGDVVEAVDIGRTIYQNFLMTVVRPGHECVSACVFVLMAGAVRTPADGASIGLHRPLLVSWSNIGFTEARARYNLLMDYLRDYFIQLGVSESAYRIMMSTSSYGMRYFSPAELDQLGLRGEDPAWEKLYGAKWAADTAPRTRPAITAAALPKLPAVDERYRTVVFMPGAFHPGIDYFAGAHIPKIWPAWVSLDDDQPEAAPAKPPDIAVFARRLAAALKALVGPVWWLFALGAAELLRARPWPGDPWARRDRPEQWRLRGFS